MEVIHQKRGKIQVRELWDFDPDNCQKENMKGLYYVHHYIHWSCAT